MKASVALCVLAVGGLLLVGCSKAGRKSAPAPADGPASRGSSTDSAPEPERDTTQAKYRAEIEHAMRGILGWKRFGDRIVTFDIAVSRMILPGKTQPESFTVTERWGPKSPSGTYCTRESRLKYKGASFNPCLNPDGLVPDDLVLECKEDKTTITFANVSGGRGAWLFVIDKATGLLTGTRFTCHEADIQRTLVYGIHGNRTVLREERVFDRFLCKATLDSRTIVNTYEYMEWGDALVPRRVVRTGTGVARQGHPQPPDGPPQEFVFSGHTFSR